MSIISSIFRKNKKPRAKASGIHYNIRTVQSFILYLKEQIFVTGCNKKNKIDKLNSCLDMLIKTYKEIGSNYDDFIRVLNVLEKDASLTNKNLKNTICKADNFIERTKENMIKQNYDAGVEYFNKGIEEYDLHPFGAYYWFLQSEPLLKKSADSENNSVEIKKDCLNRLVEIYQKEIIIGNVFYDKTEAPDVIECINKKKEAEEILSGIEKITIN